MFPQQVGRFQILGSIGENERGTVFRAYDPQLQREVALKLLKTQYLYTITSEKAFTAEAEKLRQLNHEAILPIYDYGDEDNRPFLVMPLMVGGSLTEMRKKNGPLPLEKTVEIFTPLANALDYCASQDIFHLDLKPSNILFDQHGHPFLADLGLVQIIDVLTTAKPPQANPHYISPEQVRGRTVDARSMVYSLGAILYEVLTGQPVFSGASEMVTAFKHVSELPRKPRSVRPELSEAVEPVLLRAIEKRPEDRFQSAGELLTALESAQGGVIPPEMVMQPGAEGYQAKGTGLPPGRGGAVAPTGWTFERGSRPVQTGNRAPLLIGMIAALGLVCIVGIGAFIFLASLSPASPRISSSPTPNLDDTLAVNVTQTAAAAEESKQATQIAVQAATREASQATQTAESALASTAQAEATEAAVQATAQAVETLRTSAMSWSIVMSDSFDDNTNDWVEEEINDDEFANISWNIQDGQYIWRATSNQGFVWRVWPSIDPMGDFFLAVDVQKNSGSEVAQYGLIFRNSDEDTTYYYFEVHETQEFGVYVYNRDWTTLIPLTFSDAIQPTQINHLEVIGQDDHFLFFINGEFVGDIFDNTLEIGEVGLSIGLPEADDAAVIVFDNFMVRAP